MLHRHSEKLFSGKRNFEGNVPSTLKNGTKTADCARKYVTKGTVSTDQTIHYTYFRT